MSGRALRQIARWLSKRPSESVLVLVYHRVAKANFPGRVTRSTDAFQLPRLQVEDWEGEEFAQQLVGWFDA